MTKISIIVPVYNSEKYIQRCICSVTSQNPSGCEIILMMVQKTNHWKR